MFCPNTAMKLQLASDLHLEFIEGSHPGELLVRPAEGAEVLVLAGDIANGTDVVRLFANWPQDVDIVYIMGNHEAYGRDWEQVRRDLATACHGTRIHFLDNSAAVIRGVRFLGTTLWTDMRIDGFPMDVAMRRVRASINDFDAIQHNGQAFEPAIFLEEHRLSVQWLERMLDTPFDGPTVVVTHHGPHPQSIAPQYRFDVNGGFTSDLTPLVRKAKLWLHGHTHVGFDYEAEGCRVVVNPHGYVWNRGSAKTAADFARENPAYWDDLVIEVE